MSNIFNQLSSITHKFYHRYVKQEDRLILWLSLVILAVGLIYIVINALTFKFPGNFYDSKLWLIIAPIVLVVMLIGMFARENGAERLGYFTRSYSLYFFIVVALGILSTGVQFTPFPTIDKHLLAIDQVIGVHSNALINWTYQHPLLHKILVRAYFSISYQLLLIPLVLSLLLEKKAVNTYLLGALVSFLIGTTIYYFFPTAAPSSVLLNPHLTAQQHDTSLKFYEIHHYLPLSTFGGGMIAFPSFHIVWASLLTYATRNKKWLFYPILLLNIILISATVLLGWHYAIDLVGGGIVALIAISTAEYLHRCQTKGVSYLTILRRGRPLTLTDDASEAVVTGGGFPPPSSSSLSSNTIPRPFSNA